MSSVQLSVRLNEPEQDILVHGEKTDGLKTWKLLFVAFAVVAVLGVAASAPWKTDDTELPSVLKKVNMAKHENNRESGLLTLHGDAHFTYHGSAGPSHWSHIAPACGGNKQSPINIVTNQVRGKGKKAVMVYVKKESGGKMSHNAHTVDVMFPGKTNYVVVQGARYNFAQFHFHHPSEHKINGKHADAEVHFVHQDPNTKKYVVVGLMCYVSKRGGKVNQLLERVVGESGKFPMLNKQVTQFQIEATNILRAIGLKKGRGRGAFQYEGSLTTPPCSETVSWFVMKKKIMISKKVLKILKKSFAYNSRPVNPLNGRVVKNGRVKGSKKQNSGSS